MAIGVNARTAFSLFFPPILDEFGWERGITAGAFSFGFLVSAAVSPLIGRLMDRAGPRAVMELGVALMGGRPVAGAADDAALASLPDHRRHGRRRQRLPRLFRPIAVPAELVHPPARPCDGAGLRRRRHRLHDAVALGAAHDRADRLAHRLHGDGHRGSGRAGADQPVAAQAAPRTSGFSPTATPRHRHRRQAGLECRRSRLGRHRLDAAAARLRTARFWWISLGYFGGLYIWYAVQVHQTKYLLDIGFSPARRGLGAGRGQPARHSRPDLARTPLRPDRARMDLDRELRGLCDLFCGADRADAFSEPDAGLSHGVGAGRARLRPDLDHGRGGAGNIPGQALRQHFRHHHARGACGRRRRALGHRLSARPFTGSYTLAFAIGIGVSGLSAVAIWMASPGKIRAVAGRLHQAVAA